MNGSPLHPLLRAALLFAPREFRRGQGDRIAADFPYGATAGAQTRYCADVAGAGVAMHFDIFARDLGYAARALAKSPLFVVVAVGAIAMAIGANVAVGSVIEGVLLRPLPFAQAERLVFVGEGAGGTSISAPDARDVMAETQTLAALALSRPTHETLVDRRMPVLLNGRFVSANYFGVLGVRPEIGKFFDPANADAKSVVISHGVWSSAFARDPAIVGRVLHFSGASVRVAGVAPPEFRDPRPDALTAADYWQPIAPRSDMAVSREWRAFTGIARLRAAAGAATAAADTSRIVVRLARRYPADFAGISSATVTPVFARVVGPLAELLWLLAAAVAIVLLIACANIANLTLVRAAKRQREIATRSALGASGAKIAGLLFAETLLLAVAGGFAGTATAAAILHFFADFVAYRLPRWDTVALDARVLLLALVLVGVTVALIGILPAVMVRRSVTRPTTGATRAGDTRNANRLRAALVSFEIALAIVVVAGAGLVTRSFITLTHVPVGFDAAGVSVVNVTMPGNFAYSPAATTAFVRRAVRELHAIPGVSAAAPAVPLPFAGDSYPQAFRIVGRSALLSAGKSLVGAEFFDALRIPLLRGRVFTERDTGSPALVAVVNLRFAQRYFGGPDVIGRRIASNSFAPQPLPPMTIVGVVGDTRTSFADAVEPMIYQPAGENFSYWHFVVRANGRDAGVALAAASAFRRIFPAMAAPPVESMRALMQRDAFRAQTATLLFGMLGVIALALALSGIYAVASYSVERRTHEFGIRRAVGAATLDVVRDVLGAAMVQSIVGVAAGLVLAVAFTRLLAAVLFATSPLDGPTFGAVIALVVGCSVIAALIPAVQATRIDPATALRYE